jgi:hypothetical protein
VQPQGDVLPRGHLPDDGAPPGGQRVGIHGEREVDDARGGLHLGEEQLGLSGDREESLAGGGGSAGRAASNQHLTGGRLQGPDPLADGARGDVQVPGSGLERAEVGDRHEGGQLRGGDIHEATLMRDQKHSLAFMLAPA